MEQAETCCFTGHRPDKLPWGVREDDPRCTRLLAVYDGVPKGGTAQTLAYALRKGLAVTILDPV